MALRVLILTPNMFNGVFSTDILCILTSFVFNEPRENNRGFPAFRYSPVIEEKTLVASIKVYIDATLRTKHEQSPANC